MSGRRRGDAIKGQLTLTFEQQVPPQVEAARALRRAVGLPDSLTAPELLVKARAILDCHRSRDTRSGVSGRRAG